MSDQYTCTICKGIFDKGWSDEEAAAEKEEIFGSVPLEECDLVCDDCFNQLTALRRIKEMDC